MVALNITYYFGQIRKEYSGERALFMEIKEDGSPEFKTFLLNSHELMDNTSKMHSPMRTYIGINLDAQSKIEERFKNGGLRSAFDLDVEIVRKDIVERRAKEVSDLESTILSAIVHSGI
jgi:hypothetical protein